MHKNQEKLAWAKTTKKKREKKKIATLIFILFGGRKMIELKEEKVTHLPFPDNKSWQKNLMERKCIGCNQNPMQKIGNLFN